MTMTRMTRIACDIEINQYPPGRDQFLEPFIHPQRPVGYAAGSRANQSSYLLLPESLSYVCR